MVVGTRVVAIEIEQNGRNEKYFKGKWRRFVGDLDVKEKESGKSNIAIVILAWELD